MVGREGGLHGPSWGMRMDFKNVILHFLLGASKLQKEIHGFHNKHPGLSRAEI